MANHDAQHTTQSWEHSRRWTSQTQTFLPIGNGDVGDLVSVGCMPLLSEVLPGYITPWYRVEDQNAQAGKREKRKLTHIFSTFNTDCPLSSH